MLEEGCSLISVRKRSQNLPLHANKLQVAAKVPGIQPRDWQSISESSHRRLEIALIKVRIEVRRLINRRVRVGPHKRDGATRNATTLVRDLDGDVLLAFGDYDLGHRELLLVLAVCLDDGSQRVLEGLEEHVRQVAWHVHEIQVGVADKLDAGGFEESVVIFADEPRVLYGFLGEFVDVRFRTYDADICGISIVAL